MATYLVRFVEVGRERQPGRDKLRRDLARAILSRIPGATISHAPGRLVVDADSAADVTDELAALPGIVSVSPVVRVAYGELEATCIAIARRWNLGAGARFAVRVRRRGERRGGADERSPEIARRLGHVIATASGARIDLERPDVELGVELRGDDAFVYDRIAVGVDRAGPTAPRAPGDPRFVADQMLGRLAARLRLLGYDTVTVYDLADSEVTRLAAADGRILLTRDGALAQTRAVPVLRVTATTTRAQLAEVLDALSLVPDPARYFTRCTLCNALVEPVGEAAVHDRLPPGARGRALTFFRCSQCAQIYWRGSHVERILADLARSGLDVDPASDGTR